MATTRNPMIAEPRSGVGIPQVAPVIPRNGLWSGYNQLGFEASYGPDRRATQTVLKLDEWGPPDVWTISLFLEQKFKAYDGFGIKARIGFGAGGSTQVVEMDWLNGAQISLPMNAVNVEAIFSDIEVTTEGAGLSVGVQLARGRRGGNLPPRYTIAERLAVNAGQTSAEFETPKFASGVYALPVGNINVARVFAADQFLELVRGSSALTSKSISGTQLGLGQRVPLSGEARRVRYSNQGASNVIVDIVAELFG